MTVYKKKTLSLSALPVMDTHKKRSQISLRPFRAENEARTRDPNLGKVVLYQLSYFRVLLKVKRRRLELPRLAALPPQSSASTIPPPLHVLQLYFMVPKTGVEPARLSTHAPETCASTNSATWARN